MAQAIEAFEADPLLQELFRSRLLEQLEEIAKRQESIGADVQKLMLFASGDRDLLEQILGGTEQIAETLDSGVNLSDEAIERIRATVGQEAADSREVRAIAVREIGPMAELLEQQVTRLQVRAVELGLHGGYLLVLALGSDLLFGAAALALVDHRTTVGAGRPTRIGPTERPDRRDSRRGHMRAQLPTSCQRPFGDIGSRVRHSTRTRPLLAWWFVRWLVRDAELVPHPCQIRGAFGMPRGDWR